MRDRQLPSALRFGCPNVCVRFLGSALQALEFFLEFLHVFIRQVFKVDKFITRTFKGPDQFVEFQLNGFPVAVLGVLNQEHHQEGYDGCTRVNDKLPRIGKMKHRPGRGPDDDDGDCDNERPRRSNRRCGISRESAEQIIDLTAE